MTLMELRDFLESSIPAWVVLPVILFTLGVALYGIVTRGPRR